MSNAGSTNPARWKMPSRRCLVAHGYGTRCLWRWRATRPRRGKMGRGT